MRRSGYKSNGLPWVLAADFERKLNSVHARMHNIGQHEVVGATRKIMGKRLVAISLLCDLKASTLEDRREHSCSAGSSSTCQPGEFASASASLDIEQAIFGPD
jgi:hypothetical protein